MAVISSLYSRTKSPKIVIEFSVELLLAVGFSLGFGPLVKTAGDNDALCIPDSAASEATATRIAIHIAARIACHCAALSIP